MNPLVAVHYPTSSNADLDRLQALCEQLAGFDDTLSLEWLDGAMTALAAGPRQRPLIEWRDRLLGETWARTFGDPQSDREATAVLQARWSVLLRQLDPEPLMEAPDDLRLAPVMLDWSDEEDDALSMGEDATVVERPADGAAAGSGDRDEPRSDAAAEGDAARPPEPAVDMTPDASDPRGAVDDAPRTGEVWAVGFMEVVATFVEDWPEDIDTYGEQAEAFEDALARIAVLGLADDDEIGQTIARLHADAQTAPTRDELIEDALYAVQDLRLFFVENAPKPETRRVEPQPGRNDPCSCGSGLKFKKCHGRA